MLVPQWPNNRWSLDFVADQFIDGRRLRILVVVDDCAREYLALVPDTSISGTRVARELDRLTVAYGKPTTIVSDNGTELTSNAILRWTDDHKVGNITSRRASRFRMPWPSPSSVACATSCWMRLCSARSHIRAPFWKLGVSTTTTNGPIRGSAG